MWYLSEVDVRTLSLAMSEETSKVQQEEEKPAAEQQQQASEDKPAEQQQQQASEDKPTEQQDQDKPTEPEGAAAAEQPQEVSTTDIAVLAVYIGVFMQRMFHRVLLLQ